VRKAELLAVAIVGCAVARGVLWAGASAADAPEPASRAKASGPMGKADISLMTLDPGHFHAALIQRESYPGVAPRVDVYAPLGQDLVDHLARVARFNNRQDHPTDWRLEVHAGPDFLARMKKDKPGNVVVISGRNRGKIDYIQTSVASGFHALVDKPWILASDDLPKLKETLDLADKKGRIALDIMTERFEVATMLQREMVGDPAVIGEIEPGSPDKPGVYMESVHHLMKVVAGVPNIRPAWFFDGAQQGEGLSDTGTHLVDLVQWTLFPDKALDYGKDLEILSAQRWPTVIPLASFQRVTGEKAFPSFLARDVKNGALEYFANTLVTYRVRGIHTRLNVIWDWEAPPGGGDTHFAFYRGSKARVEVRQGRAQRWRTELYVIPTDPARRDEVMAAVGRRLTALLASYPGLAIDEPGGEIHVAIPDRFRTTHEEHFGQVARRFFGFLQNPRSLPAWEKPNMLAKYWVTTRGTELSRRSPPRVAERLGPR
jgi:predicted dehydrogenase